MADTPKTDPNMPRIASDELGQNEAPRFPLDRGLTTETAWWQPRAGKKLKDLSTAELNALAAGLGMCVAPDANPELIEAMEIYHKIKAELVQRGNPLVMRQL